MKKWFIYSFIAMVLEGTLLFIVKLLSLDTSLLTVLLFQYVGSLICTVVYLTIRRVKIKVKPAELIRILLSGFMVTTGFSFYYTAISMAPASIVVPLHNVGLTLLPSTLAFVFLREKINARVIIGIVCAVLCIILLTM